VPDWRGIAARFTRLAHARSGRPTRFASPARAQVWFEWRRHGRSLPFLVGLLLPFELGLLFVFPDTRAIVFATLVGVLLTPPFLAVFVAATVGRSSPHAGDRGLSPFVAARPLSTPSLVAATLEAALWSALAAWLVVLVALPLGVALSGTAPPVVEAARRLVAALGMPRAVAIGLLAIVALVASTWKQLVQSLYLGMSGREWLVKTSVFLNLSLLAVLIPLADSILRSKSALAALLWNAPTVIAVLVWLKLLAAGWIARQLHDRQVLSDRALVAGAVCWDVIVFALYGVLAWILPSLLVRRSLLALVAILEVPLVRVSAAPLALAWNRHR